MEKVLMADLYNLTYEASYAESKAKILESCQNCFTWQEPLRVYQILKHWRQQEDFFQCHKSFEQDKNGCKECNYALNGPGIRWYGSNLICSGTKPKSLGGETFTKVSSYNVHSVHLWNTLNAKCGVRTLCIFLYHLIVSGIKKNTWVSTLVFLVLARLYQHYKRVQSFDEVKN